MAVDYSLASLSPAQSWIDTSWDQPAYSGTVLSDIATQGQTISTTPTNDSWGDWFKSAADTVLNYSIAKDAVQTKAAVTQPAQPTAQPGLVYAQAPATAINANVLMLAGVAVVAVLLLKN